MDLPSYLIAGSAFIAFFMMYRAHSVLRNNKYSTRGNLLYTNSFALFVFCFLSIPALLVFEDGNNDRFVLESAGSAKDKVIKLKYKPEDKTIEIPAQCDNPNIHFPENFDYIIVHPYGEEHNFEAFSNSTKSSYDKIYDTDGKEAHTFISYLIMHPFVMLLLLAVTVLVPFNLFCILRMRKLNAFKDVTHETSVRSEQEFTE